VSLKIEEKGVLEAKKKKNKGNQERNKKKLKKC